MNEVGKFEPKLENFVLFNTELKTFQLRSILSNLNRNFLTPDFPTQNVPTSHFSNCSFQLPLSRLTSATMEVWIEFLVGPESGHL